ncbi:metal-dependent hydrolase [Ralstonia sp. 25mfcol4.1]|uniref:metal-dependent hydrolase n=1 Tax=Ralstonia sp. 25mfcol4.1 TaxID=1761899 RepID=UPI001587712E|nr:metal-dependent hydrolase [Ralstonia sp. 25mfcol4.1]
MAPINQFARGRVSAVSLVLANIFLDSAAIKCWLTSQAIPDHPPMTHSFLAAIPLGAVIALVGFRSRPWTLGAFLGTLSHILLDMLVHAEMQPFYPLKGNAFFMDWMEPLSWGLAPLTCWFIFQCVSSGLDWIGRFRKRALGRSRVSGVDV